MGKGLAAVLGAWVGSMAPGWGLQLLLGAFIGVFSLWLLCWQFKATHRLQGLTTLLLYVGIALSVASIPRPVQLQKPVYYTGVVHLFSDGGLRDSLGQWWRCSDAVSSNVTCKGEVILYPWIQNDLPYAYNPGDIWLPRGYLGRAQVSQVLDCLPEDEKGTFKVKNGWKAAVAELGWSEDAQKLIHALFLGEARGLRPELRQFFQHLGLAHLLAVSGFHLGLLWTLLKGLQKFCPYGWKNILNGFAITLVWSYVGLLSFPISAVRAACMMTALAWGQSRQGKSESGHALGIAVWLMLLWEPGWVADLGFQLSVIAVAGILWVRKALPSGAIWQGVGVSLAAQWATTPIAVATFHQFPLWFLPANLFVAPMVLLLYPYTLLALCLQATSLHMAFPEGLVQWVQSAGPNGIWAARFPSTAQTWALWGSALLGLWAWRAKRWGLVALGLGATVFFLWETGPKFQQEWSWHRYGRGVAQVEVRGDSAFIQVTKGFAERTFYWEKTLKPYFTSRGVNHINKQVVKYQDTPDNIRAWADTTVQECRFHSARPSR